MESYRSPIFSKILIIGGGPSGLSAAYTLSKFTNDFLIAEMGLIYDVRDRDDKFDCIAGLGGAGLFSDGKFSFFPSGSNIWKVKDQQNLEDGYKDLQNLFQNSIGLTIPSFPSQEEIGLLSTNETFELKLYPSSYISLEDRKKLVQELISDYRKILLGWKALDWVKEKNGFYKVELEVSGEKRFITCEYLILAGGRFYPLLLSKIPKIFRRYEFGVRLVGKNEKFEKVQSKETIDPKWIYRPTSKMEFRTFCMCKDGEYVQSKFCGYQSVSGRADVPPSGITNFGLTLRLKEESDVAYSKVLECEPFEYKLKEIMEDRSKLEEKFGEKLADAYLEGLKKFIDDFDIDIEDLKVVGPCLEGVGSYPKLAENLQMEGENIFAIGDCSGIFRGIIPSMVSGHFVGMLLGKKHDHVAD